MIKRLGVYFREMYPIIPRLVLGYIVAMEIYYIVLLNHGVSNVNFGIQEVILGFTVFSFLCWLRIADDFKDYELDCRLFKHRPLPSGRVHKSDLKIFVSILIALTILVNFIFMPLRHFIFCIILYTYGSMMAVWFFQKHKIQKSLPLALVTHNPVQMILNIYIISYVIIRYNLEVFNIYNIMAIFTLYFPALAWEVSRKVRAPEEETEYVTYSKLFGYKRATNFALWVTIVDIVTNIILVINLNKISVILLILNIAVLIYKVEGYKKNPLGKKLVDIFERYTYIQEATMIGTIVCYMMIGKI